MIKNEFDVIVAGSGAGGLSTAIVAANEGLSVLVIEKSDKFGGTTSRSGGWIWIPNNSHAKREGLEDSAEKARTYIEAEAGNQFDATRVDAFLNSGPKMLDWFDRNTDVKFTLGSYFPDYHPYQPGGMDGGRSLNADPVNLATLGKNADRLAPPIPEGIPGIGTLGERPPICGPAAWVLAIVASAISRRRLPLPRGSPRHSR